MASGWAKEGAVQEQIDDTIADAIRRAREQLPSGPGSTHCDDCGEPIPEARRKAVPGTRRCVSCQSEHDGPAGFSSFNRSGSKDSQLR